MNRYRISGKSRKWKVKVVDKRKALQDYEELGMINDIDVKISLIQALIPIGLDAVQKQLQKEVLMLAGKRYQHGKEYTRWGRQNGSVYLQNQKVPIRVPRVRNIKGRSEVPLDTYRKLQDPYQGDERLFKQLIHGLSMNRYGESAALVPEVFGISGSRVSGRFKHATVKRLRYLQSRNLNKYDFVAIFIDGKRFADEGVLVSIGITIHGEKIVLGIEQMNTENHRSTEQFFNKLIERGLRHDQGLLFIIDGSKGLYKGIKRIFQGRGVIQRCWWHKQENVVSYLSKPQQVNWRRQIQEAYRNPSYKETHKALSRIADKLDSINTSAGNSLRKGLEETLTIHKLGLYNELKRSFCTTNCIESVLSAVAQYTQRVDRWRDGSHIQRWVAAGLLEVEPRLTKISGYKHLAMLRKRIQEHLQIENDTSMAVLTEGKT